MYTPYDREQDTDWLPSPAKVLVGGLTVGTAGLAAGGTWAVMSAKKRMANGPARAEAKSLNLLHKQARASGLASKWSPKSMFWAKRGEAAWGAAMTHTPYMWRSHDANKVGKGLGQLNPHGIDKGFYKMFNINLKQGAKMMRFPAGALLTAMTLSAEVDEHGLKGLMTGGVKEAGGLAGGIIGGAVGGMVGSVAGGMIGYMALEPLMWASKKGRQWTNPDFGGSFHDSEMAQTMRARSMNAIRTSQFNVRNALGSEAMNLVMGW